MKIPIIAFKSFKTKVTLFLILAMIFAGAASNFLIYRYALASQFQQLRDKLMTIAQTTALTVSTDEVAAMPSGKEGIDSPKYKAVCGRLAEIRKVVPTIRYIYVLERTDEPGILRFLADSDAGASEGGPVTYPGDKYDARKFPEMLKAFGAPAADRKLERDQWGVFLSGYAPMRDKAGKAVAILGVDMKAQDVYDVQWGIFSRSVATLCFVVITAALLGIIISAGVTKRIDELMKGVSRISKGDMDYKVRIKGADEIARLGYIFNGMSSALKRHMEDLKRTTAEKERLVKEIEIARGIQQSFLPDASPDIPGLDVAAVSLPARVVGGDFYDFIPLSKDRWGLVVADVSGKGVPAALFMALSRTLMRSTAQGAALPSDAINHANNLILQDSKANMFVTLFYAVFDQSALKLEYANAGHNPPLMVTGSKNSIVMLKAQGVPLGILSEIKATTDSIALKKGDLIVLYTDGVTEAVNDSGEQFETERLEKIAVDNRHLSSEDIIGKIRSELTEFVGERPQFDDITIMVLKAT